MLQLCVDITKNTYTFDEYINYTIVSINYTIINMYEYINYTNYIYSNSTRIIERVCRLI